MDEFKSIRKAAQRLNTLGDEQRSRIIKKVSEAAVAHTDRILKENEKDLARMNPEDPKYDRLLLNKARLESIASDLVNVANLPTPVGLVLEHSTLPNGLDLTKVSVPLGVVGIIYEARPNVTFDVFGICFKSGNACVLKGGSDAEHSNTYIVTLIQEVLQSEGVDTNAITLLPSDRQSAEVLLNAVGHVDVIIPRGGKNLIDYVRSNSRVPVIETGAGIVHTYVDRSADIHKASDIVYNAKTRRVSVCNALDCLVIHADRLKDLPAIINRLKDKSVILYTDKASFEALRDSYPPSLLQPAGPEHYGTEFLDYKMSIRTVANLDEALHHISENTSHHSEAIVAEDAGAIDRFLKEIDAAAVYANTSTAFTDGAQFGLGAEIGISTQKLHARGPMGLRELTSYKWIVRGNGAIRVP